MGIKMEAGKMQPPPGGSRKRAAGLSLDLNSASAKRNKQVQSLLTSPDVQMLKLTSPELEKFLIQNPPLATPSPSLEPHPNLDILQIKMEPGKMQPPPGGSRKRAAGLSLDLNSASAKRNKQVQSLLTSPDVQMLKLTSPEL